MLGCNAKVDPAFSTLLASVDSCESLSRKIAHFFPEAAQLDRPSESPDQVSRILLDAIEAHAAENGVVLDQDNPPERYLHESRMPDHERLATLKRVPPPEIHRMQRSEFWFGDRYSANMCLNAMSEIGLTLEPGMQVLDYGCSSGSLLRLLAYCFPDVSFQGCDPVDASIVWAQENLTYDNLRFFHQDQEPPLSLPDASLDVVTAVSIFSHHGINATTRWLDEVARVLKPGGHLVLTYNDVGAFHRAAQDAKKSYTRIRALLSTFMTGNYVFEEVWVDKDDAGNAATVKEWGNSFYTYALMCGLAAEHFTPVYHGRRQNQGRQDLLILKRNAPV